jgi:hypothetical protein
VDQVTGAAATHSLLLPKLPEWIMEVAQPREAWTLSHLGKCTGSVSTITSKVALNKPTCTCVDSRLLTSSGGEQ